MQLLIKTFSIHASAKEATLRTPHYRVLHYIFNPRLREGGDKEPESKKVEETNFQSTPPRRRRHVTSFSCSCFHFFSIHASAKEATKPQPKQKNVPSFSIHASAKEATLESIVNPHIAAFQSTPPRRRRLCKAHI